MAHRLPILKPLAAAAAWAACSAVLAAPVGLTSSSSATTGDPVSPTTIGVPSGTNNSPLYTQSSTSASETGVGEGRGNSFANQWGSYAAGANAEGKATGGGSSVLSYLIENSTSLRQSYSMSFFIYGGSIGTGLASGATLSDDISLNEYLQAAYSASIMRGSTALFSSNRTVYCSGAAFNCILFGTGTSLSSDDVSDGIYSWSGQTFNISLGELDPGENMVIQATVVAGAQANVGTYNFSGGSGYGCGYEGYTLTATRNGGAVQPQIAEVPQQCFKGFSNTFYGDPASITNANTGANAPPIVITNQPVGTVPVPGSAWLAALGLLAVGAARRKR